MANSMIAVMLQFQLYNYRPIDYCLILQIKEWTVDAVESFLNEKGFGENVQAFIGK